MNLELLKTDFKKHCENPHRQTQPQGCSMYCFAILFNDTSYLKLLEEQKQYEGMTREDENELLLILESENKVPLMQISPLASINQLFGKLDKRLVSDILGANEKEFDSIENIELLVPIWLTVLRGAKDKMLHRVLIVISNEFYYLIDPMFKYLYKFTDPEMFVELYEKIYSVERLMIKTNGNWSYGFLKRTVNNLELI